MKDLTQRYGVRRVAEIAAKVEAARAALPLPVQPSPAKIEIAQTLGLLVASQIEAPTPCACGARVVFGLVDETGRSLPKSAGGFCRDCAPCQLPEDETPETGTPAPLALIEAAAFRAKMSGYQLERARLRLELAGLHLFQPSGAVCADIARIEARLADLDDFLICEEEVEFDFGFEKEPEFDEFDADLPDELDGSFPFRFGFDDLPQAYFTAQEVARLAA
jgi:hypothetical protein